MNDHISTNPQKKGWIKYKDWTIGLFCFVLIAGVYLHYKPLIEAYYYNYKDNNFQQGDKVYLSGLNLKDTTASDITLEELVRPLTEADVDTMHIELWKKELAKKALSSSKSTFLIDSKHEISIDSLRKHNTRCVGTYVRYEVKYFDFHGKSYPLVYYVIVPDRKLFAYNEYYNLPSGYTVDNKEEVYIPAFKINNK
jgi:hypothetical protein